MPAAGRLGAGSRLPPERENFLPGRLARDRALAGDLRLHAKPGGTAAGLRASSGAATVRVAGRVPERVRGKRRLVIKPRNGAEERGKRPQSLPGAEYFANSAEPASPDAGREGKACG